MSTTYVQPMTLGDVLLASVPKMSTDQAVLTAGHVYQLGQVLGKVGDKFTPLDPAANTGAEVASGICADNIDATDSDKKATVIVRMAAVNTNALILPAGLMAPQLSAVAAQLDARHIVLRISL